MDNHLVSLLQPQSFEAEQYRRLRQRLEDVALARQPRVLAVTSAVASDGKTLTSINLAAALAGAPNSRILLIDADLRRPSVAKHLDLPGDRPGLFELLSRPGGRLLDYTRGVSEGLATVAGGAGRASTYELLRSKRVTEILAEARRDYDYVILDTPPVIPVPDTGLLRRAVDGYILVVSANTTPRKLLAEALNLLDPSAVLGLVFNRDTRPLFGYYSTHYRRYFESPLYSVDQATA
jgi:protein-tyrosine kinase